MFRSGTKCIVFDADDTLFIVRGTVGEIYSVCCARHGLTIDADALNRRVKNVWSNHHKTYLNADENYVTSSERERDSWRKFVYEMLAPFAGPAECDAVFEEIYFEFARGDSREPLPGVVEALAHLKERGYTLAVLSNNDSRIRQVCNELEFGKLIDRVMPSAELGIKKPAIECFRAAERLLDLEAASIAYIGDSLDHDYFPARQAGWQAIWFRAGRPADPRAASAIDSFQELLGAK